MEQARKVIRAIENVRLKRGNLAAPEVRIGLWPIVSQSDPTAALGLTSILALLFERWQEAMVYRVFTRLDTAPNEDDWSWNVSRFTVEDWAFEGLNDDVGIWGALERNQSGWQLTLEIETEQSDELKHFTHSAVDLATLINDLPLIACDVMRFLKIPVGAFRQTVYEMGKQDTSTLKDFLELVFMFDVHLLYTAIGTSTGEAKLKHAALIDQAVIVGDDFAGWVAAALTDFAQLSSEEVASKIVPLSALIERLKTPRAQLAIGRTLYSNGQAGQGTSLVENVIEENPALADGWLTLAAMYSQSGRVKDAVRLLQSAIEEDLEDARIYSTYASLMSAIDQQGLKTDSVILIDPAKQNKRITGFEAIAAYEQALELDPENPKALLGNEISLLISLGDMSRLWAAFQQLVDIDQEGEYIRAVIDELHLVDNPSPSVQILTEATRKMPSAMLFVSSALIYLTMGREEKALECLEKARELTEESPVLAEIDRLTLSAQDAEFDMFIGECIDRLSAGSDLDESAVESLEGMIEDAPYYAEGYVLLARAYTRWEDPGAALEVLLEGQKYLPDDPEILELLARILWGEGQQDTALHNLQNGLEAHPNHVPLLVRAGQYLLEMGQVEAARDYIMRAEIIEPNHPAMKEARKKIAQLLSS